MIDVMLIAVEVDDTSVERERTAANTIGIAADQCTAISVVIQILFYRVISGYQVAIIDAQRLDDTAKVKNGCA